jgi:hypothetical protein
VTSIRVTVEQTQPRWLSRYSSSLRDRNSSTGKVKNFHLSSSSTTALRPSAFYSMRNGHDFPRASRLHDVVLSDFSRCCVTSFQRWYNACRRLTTVKRSTANLSWCNSLILAPCTFCGPWSVCSTELRSGLITNVEGKLNEDNGNEIQARTEAVSQSTLGEKPRWTTGHSLPHSPQD